MIDDAAGSRVLLIGMMGVGKSLAGALVASRLGWPHVDTDDQVEQRTESTVARLFAEHGEAAFRAAESQVLADALSGPSPVVVSVAGGAVLAAVNRRLIAVSGLVVWLRADLAVLARRVEGGGHRPLLEGDPEGRLARLYAERQPVYEALADVVIDVDHLGPDEVADQVVAAWKNRAADVSPTARGGRRA